MAGARPCRPLTGHQGLKQIRRSPEPARAIGGRNTAAKPAPTKVANMHYNLWSLNQVDFGEEDTGFCQRHTQHAY